jgi:hypothetical protein
MATSRFFVLLVLALCAILLAAQQVEGIRQLRGADLERTIVNCKTFGEERGLARCDGDGWSGTVSACKPGQTDSAKR